MYSTVSSMLRGSGRMIQRATRTTTGSLPLSKSLLRTLLKKVSVLRRKVASFLAGTRYQPGHLTEFCRKCSLCLRSIGVSYSGNPACSIKEVARDSCSSTRLGTHRYSGDDSQSGCGTQANTYSDRTRSQGASSDPGEGSLERRLNGRQLYVRRAVDSEGEVLDILVQPLGRTRVGRGFLCGSGRCPFRKSYPDVLVVQPGQDWDGDNDTGPLDPAAFEGSGLSMTHTAEFILHQFLHPSF